MKRTFTRDEMRRIFVRADLAQHVRESREPISTHVQTVGDSDALTLDDIKEIGTELGISGRHVENAAARFVSRDIIESDIIRLRAETSHTLPVKSLRHVTNTYREMLEREILQSDDDFGYLSVRNVNPLWHNIRAITWDGLLNRNRILEIYEDTLGSSDRKARVRFYYDRNVKTRYTHKGGIRTYATFYDPTFMHVCGDRLLGILEDLRTELSYVAKPAVKADYPVESCYPELA